MTKLLSINVWLLFLAVLVIFLRLFNQIQVASYFGTSAQRDSYFLANTFITFLLTIHSRSVTLFFLPKHINYLSKKTEGGIGQAFIWIHLLYITGGLLFLTTGFSFIITVKFLPFHNPQLFFQILQILLLGFIFQTTNNIITAVYHSHKQFFLPALRNVLLVVNIIVSVYLFYEKGIIVLALGYLSGNILSFFLLFFFKIKTLTHIGQWRQDFNSSFVFLREIIPFVVVAFFGVVVHLIEPLFVANREAGIISYLGYSYQIILILLTLVSASIVTTFFPKVAKLYAANKNEQLNATLQRTIKLTFVFCLSISGFVILYGQEIISLVFERGKFRSEDVQAVFRVLRWELLVFIFGALNLLLNRFFYLNKNTKTLFQATIISLCIYLIAAFTFYKYFDYEGLGMALSVWSITYFFTLLFHLKKQSDVNIKELFAFFLGITFLLSFFVMFFWQISQFIAMPFSVFKLALLGTMYCLPLLIVFLKYYPLHHTLDDRT